MGIFIFLIDKRNQEHQKPKYKEKMLIQLQQTFVLLHIAASAVRTGSLIAKI